MARKNISIGLDTWHELAALGRFGMTFDDIVKILLVEHRELDKLRSKLGHGQTDPAEAIKDLFYEVDKVTPTEGYYRAAFGTTKSREPQSQQPQSQQPQQEVISEESASKVIAMIGRLVRKMAEEHGISRLEAAKKIIQDRRKDLLKNIADEIGIDDKMVFVGLAGMIDSFEKKERLRDIEQAKLDEQRGRELKQRQEKQEQKAI